MNKQTAQLEAEKRWGNTARAWILAGVRYVSKDTTSTLGNGWNHFDGQGKTWEDAFSDAESKAK